MFRFAHGTTGKVAALVVTAALTTSFGAFGCSSAGTDGGGGEGGGSATCDVSGTWNAHFQWTGRTPGDLALISGKKSVEIPEGPGVSEADGTTSVNGHHITWKLSDGSTMSGTADSSCTFISAGTMQSSTGNAGQFTAMKDACNPVGTWTVEFQWSGRTPGELSIVVDASQSAHIPSGPGVSAASGTTDITGNYITWTMSDGSTMSGTTDASCTGIASGTMQSSSGTSGRFVATKD